VPVTGGGSGNPLPTCTYEFFSPKPNATDTASGADDPNLALEEGDFGLTPDHKSLRVVMKMQNMSMTVPTGFTLLDYEFWWTNPSADSSGNNASASYTFSVVAATTTAAAATTTASYAPSGLTAAQASAIISLLQSFGVDQNTINTVSAILNGGPVATGTSSTSATPAYTFTEYLAPGSQDNEVLMLQDLLAKLGFLTATPNGYFGNATKAAVMAFQAAHGISQLGVVGPMTRALMEDFQTLVRQPDSEGFGESAHFATVD